MKAETYTPGHSTSAVSFMARRSVESHGAFVLPWLRSGQRILDCGCGPGGISLGIARRVSPGEVIGVDIGAAQLERATQAAREAGLNATFREASIYQLPFEDASFDGVFSHALFEHLKEPARALAEIRRVLKPGGFVALRSPDWGGFVLHPWYLDIERAITAYEAMQTANGGDIRAGRKLSSWLKAAGFRNVQSSAGYEIYPSAQVIADYLALQLEGQGHANEAAALRTWSQAPDAQFAQAWFEVIGEE